MISQAAKYIVPMGTAAVLLCPKPVFAADKRACPSDVYDIPSFTKSEKSCDDECKDTELEKLVAKCRQELGPMRESVGGYANNSLAVLKDAYGSVSNNLCYLRKRAPEELRIGTVVAGGLLGLLFGIRRNIIKKILYTGIGAAGGSYLAYPDDTVYVVKNGVPIAKKYGSIAYNFVLGDNSNVPGKCGPAATLKKDKAERNLPPK